MWLNSHIKLLQKISKLQKIAFGEIFCVGLSPLNRGGLTFYISEIIDPYLSKFFFFVKENGNSSEPFPLQKDFICKLTSYKSIQHNFCNSCKNENLFF